MLLCYVWATRHAKSIVLLDSPIIGYSY